jgi:hypothetical protein
MLNFLHEFHTFNKVSLYINSKKYKTEFKSKIPVLAYLGCHYLYKFSSTRGKKEKKKVIYKGIHQLVEYIRSTQGQVFHHPTAP